MDRRTFLKAVPATLLAATASKLVQAATTATASVQPPATAVQEAATSRAATDLQPITLLKPETDGGKSVLAAEALRRAGELNHGMLLRDGPAEEFQRLRDVVLQLRPLHYGVEHAVLQKELAALEALG